jgi:hypothetical protein
MLYTVVNKHGTDHWYPARYGSDRQSESLDRAFEGTDIFFCRDTWTKLPHSRICHCLRLHGPIEGTRESVPTCADVVRKALVESKTKNFENKTYIPRSDL